MDRVEVEDGVELELVDVAGQHFGPSLVMRYQSAEAEIHRGQDQQDGGQTIVKPRLRQNFG